MPSSGACVTLEVVTGSRIVVLPQYNVEDVLAQALVLYLVHPRVMYGTENKIFKELRFSRKKQSPTLNYFENL